jgi:uncharacterized protein involved in exopolysaccharide biosynthesis
MDYRLFHYVLMRRKIILWVTLVFLLIATLYHLFGDRKYESQAMLLPPLEEGSEGMFVAWMRQMNIPTSTLPMTAGATSAALLIDILQSRRLGEYVINELDLLDRYEADGMEDALEKLRGETNISASSTGLILLSARDKDPLFAAEIARHYISGLDSLNRYLQFTRAEQTIEFISSQIERNREELERLRSELSAFQKDHGVVHFEEQVRGAIDVAADLKVRTALARIERDLLREFATDDATELRRKEAEYENLNRQLEILVKGDSSSSVFFPLEQMPGLYQEYAAMQRDMEVAERVYSYLLQKYEEAGIDRARNTPSVQIVDEPSVPENYAGLPAWGLLLLAALAGLIWSSACIAWWGWFSTRSRSEDQQRAFEEVGELIKLDLGTLRRWLRI